MMPSFSRMTLGFAATGFGLAVASIALAAISTIGNGSLDTMRAVTGFITLVCPPSFALMVLDNVRDWPTRLVVFGIIVVSNTCLYGLIGVLASTLFRLARKKT